MTLRLVVPSCVRSAVLASGLICAVLLTAGIPGQLPTSFTEAASSKKTPSVVWPTPDAVPTGTALGSAQLNASASVAGVFTYAPPAGTRLSAGSRRILSATFVPTDAGKYATATAHVTINVADAPLESGILKVPTLHPFGGRDGWQPAPGLIQARDGDLYGTTSLGGQHDLGTVFRLDANGTLTTLHSFAGSDGAKPAAGLLQASDGRFYGTTSAGGASALGTIFAITADGRLTTLHVFKGSDGAKPRAGVIQASNGRFLGTTTEGGADGYGTIFTLGATGPLSTLHSFRNKDGANPSAGLLQARDGRFYGTTKKGGKSGEGTIFVIDAAGRLTTLHSFGDGIGAYPTSALIQSGNGQFYGTTSAHGTRAHGTVFTLDQNAKLSTLYTFSSGDGIDPADLVQALDGRLHGTTLRGGPYGFGTIFRLEPDGTLTTLHAFTGTGGAEPTGLIQASDGAFYGASSTGGTFAGGTVYRLVLVRRKSTPVIVWPTPAPIVSGTPLGPAQLNASAAVAGSFAYAPPAGTILTAGSGQILSVTFAPANTDAYETATARVTINVVQALPIGSAVQVTTTHRFSGKDGSNPASGLLQTRDGRFYGTTVFGGAGKAGTIFTFGAAGAPAPVYSFSGPDGANPTGTLIHATDGRIYGTTYTGGRHGDGTIFVLDATGQLTTLHSFSGSDGSHPGAGLVEAGDRRFYGTTHTGGTDGRGSVFVVDATGAFRTLHSFRGRDGEYPSALLQAREGRFYGTTFGGGVNDAGTIFAIDAAGTLTTVHAFGPSGGAHPMGGLIQATDGRFYGTTSRSGARGFGTVFRMDASGGVATLHNFRGTDGAFPASALIQGVDGSLYGTTFAGGANGGGTLFRLNDAAPMTTLHAFSPGSGAFPLGELIQATDGRFYGTTSAGGPAGGGGIYRLPTIVWSTPAAITYGTPLGPEQLNATADGPGAWTYTPGAGTVLGAGTQTLLATFSPGGISGAVVSALAAATGDAASASVSLTILKATPAITWTAPASIRVGTPLGATQLNATADVPGTFNYEPPSGTVVGAGSDRVLSVTFTPTDSANYNTATASVLLTVNVNRTPVMTNPGPQTNADSEGYMLAVLADAPAAYWRLGETTGPVATDTAGASHGTRFGGITIGQPGALGDGNRAMLFDATTGYIRAPNTAALQVTGDLTIEMWINVPLSSRQTLISKGSRNEFEFTVETTGELNLYQGDGTTFSNVKSPYATIVANTWQHVAVTRVAATRTIRFYVNGVEKGSGTYFIAPMPSAATVVIGRSDTSSGVRYVNGLLDEVAVYSTALSGARIGTHYARRAADGTGAPVALQLMASDMDGDAVTYAASGLPTSVTLNPATGLISGVLSSADAGTYVVSATASDSLLTAGQTFTWTVTHVNRAPALTNPGNQTSAENASVSVQLVASDPEGVSPTYTASGLPPSLTLNPATGIISGTPSFSEAGTFVVAVSATDGTLSTTRAFSWTITNTNRAPVMTAPGNLTNADNEGYAQVVLADGPVAYWRLGDTSGAPAWDSAGTNVVMPIGGVTFGQPGALADSNPAIRFDGSTGHLRADTAAGLPLAGDLTLEMWVNVSLATRQTLISKSYLHELELTVETSGHLSFYQGDGTTFESAASVAGAISAHTWQHVVVTRTTATRTIRFYVNGVTKGSGTYFRAPAASPRAIVIGRDNYPGVRYVNGCLDEVAAYSTVLSPAAIAAHYVRRSNDGSGTPIAFQLVASDPDGDALTYAASGLPGSVSLNQVTGLVSGTLAPSDAGTYGVTVSASDASLTTTQTFGWTITNTNGSPVLTHPGDQTHSNSQSYEQVVRADAASAYWRLGEATGAIATDSVGRSLATMLGGVTTGQPGALRDGNTAVLLDGSTGYLRATGAAALALSGDLTLEIWINVSLATRQTLISKSYIHEFELTVEPSGHLSFYQGNGATFESVASVAGAITANTWQHVVVTRTSAAKTIRFYVNGVDRGSAPYLNAPVASLKSVVIGRSDNYPGVRYVNGLLDEVAVYPVALGPGHIAAHYSLRTADGTGTPIAIPLTASDPTAMLSHTLPAVSPLPPQSTLQPSSSPAR